MFIDIHGHAYRREIPYRNDKPWFSTPEQLLPRYEELGIEKNFQEMIYSELKVKNFFPVLLSPKSKEKPGATGNKWKVDVNVKLESDL